MFEGIEMKQYDKRQVILFNSYSRGKEEVLSNHHVCRLSYNGIVFNSSEQLFFWLLLSGHPELQEKVLNCETPKDVKRVGGQCLKKIKWEHKPENDIPALRFAISTKYIQCKEFREYLDSHPNDVYVEYATWGDKQWGATDIDENLKYKPYGIVEGQNVCGRIIQGVLKQAKKGEVIPILPDFVKEISDI